MKYYAYVVSPTDQIYCWNGKGWQSDNGFPAVMDRLGNSMGGHCTKKVSLDKEEADKQIELCGWSVAGYVKPDIRTAIDFPITIINHSGQEEVIESQTDDIDFYYIQGDSLMITDYEGGYKVGTLK
jgi:hypothetical protein